MNLAELAKRIVAAWHVLLGHVVQGVRVELHELERVDIKMALEKLKSLVAEAEAAAERLIAEAAGGAKASEALAAAQAALADAEAQLTDAEGKASEAEAKAADLQSQLDAANVQIASLEAAAAAEVQPLADQLTAASPPPVADPAPQQPPADQPPADGSGSGDQTP